MAGRPSKKGTIDLEKLYKLALLGATDEQIADFFNITRSTLSKYKAEDKEFSDTLKRGKVQADAEVADSLRNRALGYSHKETKFFVIEGKVEAVETEKHYPPDATSAIFWLKNRQRDKWKDKWEVTVEGPQYAPPTTIVHAPANCATEGCNGTAWPTDGKPLCGKCEKEGEE